MQLPPPPPQLIRESFAAHPLTRQQPFVVPALAINQQMVNAAPAPAIDEPLVHAAPAPAIDEPLVHAAPDPANAIDQPVAPVPVDMAPVLPDLAVSLILLNGMSYLNFMCLKY
jgi:hypothetical protein